MEKTEKRTTHRKGIPQGAPISPGKHLSARSRPMDRKKDAGKSKKKEKRCFGSVRNADGEYAAEQPLGLPAVIAELSRWAAQNLELTFQSEINVGSRLSEKRRRKRRIAKCNTTRGVARRKKRINQNGDREERRKRDFRACKQQATTAEKPLRASL